MSSRIPFLNATQDCSPDTWQHLQLYRSTSELIIFSQRACCSYYILCHVNILNIHSVSHVESLQIIFESFFFSQDQIINHICLIWQGKSSLNLSYHFPHNFCKAQLALVFLLSPKGLPVISQNRAVFVIFISK